MSAAGDCSTHRPHAPRALLAALLPAVLLVAIAAPATAKVSGDEVSAYAESFGVPESVAEDRLEVQDKAADAEVVTSLEDRLSGSYAGVWFDPETGELVTPIASGKARGALARELTGAKLGGEYRAPLVEHSWEELEATQDRIDPALKELFEKGLVQTSLDPEANAVVVELAASATPKERSEATRIVKGAGPAAQLKASDEDRFELGLRACSYIFDNCSRPLRGGVEFGVNGEPYGKCTTGFRAIGNANHNRYLLSAAHCAAQGHVEFPTIHWTAWDEQHLPYQGQPHYLGQLEQHAFPAHDWMKINVTGSWWDEAHPWPALVSYWNNGGSPPAYNEEYPITGEAMPYKNQVVCHSGIASGGSCGVVEATGVTRPLEGTLMYDLVRTVGACSLPGDSGGPWFASNVALGTHTGDDTAFGSCQEGHQFFTPITLATAALGVHIVAKVEAQTGAASGIVPRQATVSGVVNPAGAPTNYHVQYGPTTAFGQATALGAAGSGWDPVAVARTLNNLKGSTTYHYRLVAQNLEGTAYGQNQAFTTPNWRPAITPQTPTAIKVGHGNLNALINPQGGSTSYRFEWGKASEGFPNSVPVPDAGIGAGTANVAVSREITGLKGLTAYHWRVVAANDEGTTTSATQSFTTPDWRPTVTNEKQTEVKVVDEAGQATLEGKVNPKGFDTSYRFEWGDQAEFEAGEYNHSAPVPDGEAGSGESDVAVSATMRPIKGQTTYHYRLVAENVEGKSPNVEDRSFTTPDWRPGVSAGDVVGEDADSGTVEAAIKPFGFVTTYYLEWGTQAEFEAGEYNNKLDGFELSPGEVWNEWMEIVHELSDLKQRRGYHYRIVAENVEGEGSASGEFHTSTSSLVSHDFQQPVTVRATPDESSHSFFMGLAGHQTFCDGPDLEGEWDNGAEAVSMFPTTPFVCETAQLAIEWEMNGCGFEFDPGYGSDGIFEGEVDIGPPGCGPITSDTNFPVCGISIPSQVGLQAQYSNEKGKAGSDVVRVAVNTTRLRYSSDGGLYCLVADEVKNGNLLGEWVLEAEDAEVGPADVEVSAGFDGPEVITEQATEVTSTRARMHGTVQLDGTPAHYAFFAYPAGGSCEGDNCRSSNVEPISGESAQEVAATIKGLEPETSYEYLLAALDAEGGFSEGEALELTTEARHATRFEAGAYPAAIEGDQDVEVEFGAGSATVSCDTVTLTGSMAEATPSLALAGDYSGCKFGSANASVEMNSCSYEVNLDAGGPPYTAGYGIVCAEEGDAIEIVSYTSKGGVLCPITIPPQDIGGTLDVTEAGEGASGTTQVEGAVTGVDYTTPNKLGCKLAGLKEVGSDGYFEVDASLGAEESSESVGLAVTGGEADIGLFLTGEESEEAAEQPRFSAELFPAQASGEQVVETEFGAGSATVSCETVTLTGSMGEATPSLALAGDYSGCKFGSANASVEMNSCSYKVSLDNAGPPYTAGYGIVCAEEGDAIEIVAYTSKGGVLCPITIPPQAIDGTLDVTEAGDGASATTHLEGSVTGVDYTTPDKLGCQLAGLQEEGEDGYFEVDASLYGVFPG